MLPRTGDVAAPNRVSASIRSTSISVDQPQGQTAAPATVPSKARAPPLRRWPSTGTGALS